MDVKPQCQSIADKLKEAEEALHTLTIGQMAYVFIDQNGEQVRYTPADRSALQIYINDLRNQLDVCQGLSPKSTSAPLRFVY